MKKTVDDLIARLPSNYRQKDSDNNIYQLLSLLGAESDLSKEMIKDLSKLALIDQAEGINLDRIGENLQQRRGYLEDSIYRILLKARIKINRSNGTINEIIEVLAAIFSISAEEIKVTEPFCGTFRFATKIDQAEYDQYGFDRGQFGWVYYEPARVSLSIPPQALNQIGFSRHWFIELLNQIVAVGVRADLLYQGTFAFAKRKDQADYGERDTGFSNEEQEYGGTLGAYFDPSDNKGLPLTR